ncbi:MAG: hypothetical protein V5789_04295 [Colwellia sp.]
MEFIDIYIGMKYGSKKGSGTVSWLDGSTHTIYMVDSNNNHNFEVNISDITDDPQAHNKEGDYY